METTLKKLYFPLMWLYEFRYKQLLSVSGGSSYCFSTCHKDICNYAH